MNPWNHRPPHSRSAHEMRVNWKWWSTERFPLSWRPPHTTEGPVRRPYPKRGPTNPVAVRVRWLPLSLPVVQVRLCAQCRRPIVRGQSYFEVTVPDGSTSPVHDTCMGEAHGE